MLWGIRLGEYIPLFCYCNQLLFQPRTPLLQSKPHPAFQTVGNWRAVRNRPFPSSLLPLFQNESKCETFHMKMSFTHKSIRMQIILIFIWKISHLDSVWNRGRRQLGNGLFNPLEEQSKTSHVEYKDNYPCYGYSTFRVGRRRYNS